MSLHLETAGVGPPLVFLHGWGFTGRVWEELQQHLRDAWQVHLVDLPGYGRSTRQGRPHTLEETAEALAAATPPHAVWIGWSLGGQVLLEVARCAPQHLAGAVLVSCNPCFTRSLEWPHGVDPATFDEFARTVQQSPAETLNQFISLCALGGDNARLTIRYLRGRTTPIGQSGRAALGVGLRILAGADLRAPLSALDCPALLVTGAQDPLVPLSAAPAMCGLQPRLKHVEIAGSAHAPFVSNRDEFLNVLLAFLRTTHGG